MHEFLNREREEQLKRETTHVVSTTEVIKPSFEERVTEVTTVIKDEKVPEIFSREVETSYTITKQLEPTIVSETTTISKESSAFVEKHVETTTSQVKFDVTKIRTDTLSKFDLGGDRDDAGKESKKFVPKDLDLKETSEITKEQVKPVIDDILQKGTIAAASRSPVLDKDIKTITKDIVESEKRSYDAKVPHKEERRHSCISPAISLERIAESEIETEEEVAKEIKTIVIETKVSEIKTEMKKSDSAMKQMADNIEIIIKQASEDVDGSTEEEPVVEETSFQSEPQDIAGQVSVDSIIEEAVTTVEGYLESSKEAKEKEIEAKKEIIYEETKKFVKERPGLIKSLSRDSGEIVIMPKKKHPRTFSVQSSPEEVEEQIYTDSESGTYHLIFLFIFLKLCINLLFLLLLDMDKAKVLEIIEPSSDLEGKIVETSFDPKKIRTDSLDDADDFPEKEVIFLVIMFYIFICVIPMSGRPSMYFSKIMFRLKLRKRILVIGYRRPQAPRPLATSSLFCKKRQQHI